MYDIQLSERNIVIEKSGLIGVFVQQNYSQTNAPRVQASGCHSFIHSYSFNLKKIIIRNCAWHSHIPLVSGPAASDIDAKMH